MAATVEFIAGHALQAQCAESVFAELNRTHECTWRLGRRLPYLGADVAVLIDHTSNHPNVVRSWHRYRHVFFMLHDMGDVDVYEREKRRLQKFTALLVPNALHVGRARRALGESVPIHEVGWPKFDRQELSPEHRATVETVRQLPKDRPTIMYAPNCPSDAEWDLLWMKLKGLPVNFVVKNATYEVGKGDPIPSHYQRIIATIDRMESEVRASGRPNTVITARDLNICALFPYVTIVVSTKSSVLAEFLLFGVSIEVDMPWPPEIYSALISRDYSDIVVLTQEELYAALSSAEALRLFLQAHPQRALQRAALCRYPAAELSAGLQAADSIRGYIEKNEGGNWWRRAYATVAAS